MSANASRDLMLNAPLEVVPGGPSGYQVRLPLWGRAIDANPYQIGLLQRFQEGGDLDRVLKGFPFHVEESRRFLERCVAEGFLINVGPDGAPVLPARVMPLTPLFHAPLFDPEHPPAFAFLGAPWDGATSGLPGARFGPMAIRQTSGSARYQVDPVTFGPQGFYDYASGRRLLEGIQLADAGDVYLAPGEAPSVFFDRLTAAVEEIRRAGAIPLVMGGDHSITFPILRAFASEKLSVIHLDAHTDLGGRLGGTLDHGNVFSHVLQKLEHVQHLYQAGLRGVYDGGSHGSAPRVTGWGIDRLRREGIPAFLAQIPDDQQYYLSLDIDVVDPAFAPATGTPVAGGLFPHEIKDLVRAIASHRMLVGGDLVEVGQPSGSFDSTPGVALECLLSIADGVVEYARSVLAAAEGEP